MKSKSLILTWSLIIALIFNSYQAFAQGDVIQNNGGTVNQANIFIDVSQDNWAYQAISDMAKRGIINGYAEGDSKAFKPQNPISRQEFAKLIASTFNLDLPSPTTPDFSDVQPGDWSYTYVEATKDYLTGYYPPKGKAFFDPGATATREDVAVALVKVLGMKKVDLQDQRILSSKFTDIDKISFGLRDYVAVAVEQHLISGYEDYTFRPDQPISRAEVASLLYRTIKSTSSDQTDTPTLQISVPENIYTNTYYVSGTTNKNAKVTINNQEVDVTEGHFKDGYTLDKEGTYDVVVVSKFPNGKSTTVKKQITYQIGAPQLKIDDVVEISNVDSITVSGTVADPKDSNPIVYLNDEKLNIWSGSFSKTVSLNEGNNILTFKAKNNLGKTTIVTKTVTFNAAGPLLKLDILPDIITIQTLTISGTVMDKNDTSPSIYLNDTKLNIWGSSFSKNVNLVDGDNTFVIKAVNKNGKTTIITKKVTFNSDAPIVKLDGIPDTSIINKITISGTVNDKNDNSPSVYVNDEKQFIFGGSFSKIANLIEGVNTITIKATNSSGKTTIITKTIVFNVGNPTLKLDPIPETTSLSSITISGTITDQNDNSPSVFVNDEKQFVWSTSFSKIVNLNKGANAIKIVATNNLGKNTTVTKSVYYQN